MVKSKVRATKFDFFMYTALKYSLLILAMAFVSLGRYLNKNYFVKFTLNNQLTDNALHKIMNFRIFLFVSGIVVLILYFAFQSNKEKIVSFIAVRKNFIQNLFLFFATVIVFLAVTEASLRIFLPTDFKYNFPPGTSSFDSKYVDLNDEGYRDYNHEPNKQKNVVRIAGLGDSFTFGTGIKNVNNTHLMKLQSQLNKNESKFDVMNFGIRGADTEDEINILRKDALKYHPNIILVGYVLNDFINFEGQNNKPNFYLFWIDKYLKDRLYSYYFLNLGYLTVKEKLGLQKDYYNFIKDSFNSANNQKLNEESFRKLEEISKDNNATVVIVIFPFMYHLSDYPFVDAHNYVSRVSKENNIAVIDLLPYFKDYADDKIIVSRYDRHPNELGHEIAAKSIYENLKKLDILKNNKK